MIRSDFGFSVSLLPAGQGAVEGAAAGLQADPAAAGRATLAGAAVAGTADVQPASVLGVVHKRQSVPHEGHRRLEETGHLARKRRKRRFGEGSTLVGTALSLAISDGVTPGRDGLICPALRRVNSGGFAASGMSRRLKVEWLTALTVDCGGSAGELPAMTMVTSARITFAAVCLDGSLVAKEVMDEATHVDCPESGHGIWDSPAISLTPCSLQASSQPRCYSPDPVPMSALRLLLGFLGAARLAWRREFTIVDAAVRSPMAS